MCCYRNIVLLVLTSLFGFPAHAAGSELGQFNISTSEGARPSAIMTERVLSHAYAQLGIKPSFVATPGLRMLAMWNNAQLDAIAFKIIDTGLTDAIKISVPVSFEEIVVYSNKIHFRIDGYDSLKPYVVGYLIGIPYLENRLENVPKKDHAPNLESLFRKLSAGRSEIVVESRFSSCIVKKLGLSDIEMLRPSLEKRLGYHFIHSRHRNLAHSIEAVLRSMEKEGLIKKIQEEVLQEQMELCPSVTQISAPTPTQLSSRR